MSKKKPTLTAEEKADRAAYAALPDNPDYNQVWLGEPRPNPIFPQWMHEITRFLSYAKPVPCGHCGRRSKKHWTQFTSFTVADEPGKGDNPFVVKHSEKVYPPLTPICMKHIGMSPCLPKLKEKKP